MVGSMMTGLCLGSLLAARFLPKLKAVPRVYGQVEMAVGIYSISTPGLFPGNGSNQGVSSANGSRPTRCRSKVSRS